MTEIEGSTAKGGGSLDSLAFHLVTEHGHIWRTSTDLSLIDPVSHWKLDENTDNPYLEDSVSYEYGTASQNTQNVSTEGKTNRGVSFGGENDYVNFGDLEELRSPGYFSIAVWFKRSLDTNQATSHGVENVIVAKAGSTSSDNLEIGSDGSNLEIYLNSSEAEETESFDAGIQDGSWYHLVLAYDQDESNEAVVYLNGEKIKKLGSWGGTLTDSTDSPLSAGVSRAGSDNTGDFSGVVDDLRVYDFDLSAEQVVDLYNGGSGTSEISIPDYASTGAAGGPKMDGLFPTLWQLLQDATNRLVVGAAGSDHSEDTELGEKPATGSYSSDLTDLTVGTTYYTRSYATTATGETVYGEIVSFVATEPSPTVTPTPTATLTPTPTATLTPTPTATLTPTPTTSLPTVIPLSPTPTLPYVPPVVVTTTVTPSPTGGVALSGTPSPTYEPPENGGGKLPPGLKKIIDITKDFPKKVDRNLKRVSEKLRQFTAPVTRKLAQVLEQIPVVGPVVKKQLARLIETAATQQVPLFILIPLLLIFAPPIYRILPLIPYLNLPAILTGLLRHNRVPWGVVYDSTAKLPLDPVVVTLIDEQNRKQQAITDFYGRYSFLVRPGSLRLETNRTNYVFPSQRLKGQDADRPYEDLYFGETLTMKGEEKIMRDIPMDPTAKDWNQQEKERQGMRRKKQASVWLHRITSLLFFLGLVWSAVVTMLFFSLTNLLVLGLYGVIYLVQRLLARPYSWGVLKDAAGKPVSGAVVRIEKPELPGVRIVPPVVTDETGRYNFLVSQGTYQLMVELKQEAGAYQEVYRSQPIVVKKKYGEITNSIRLHDNENS